MHGLRIQLYLAFLCFASLLHAQAPEINRILPRSARPGETVDITLSGNNLLQPGKLWTNFGAELKWLESATGKGDTPLKADSKKLFGKLTLPADAPLGIGFLRLPTSTGLSGALFFLVDDLSTAIKKSQNNSHKDAQDLTLPGAIAGSTEAGRSDFYKVTLKEGEGFSLEVFASRIGSRLDPLMRLLDSHGQEVHSADDGPGLAGDCRLRYRAAVGGTYFVEIRDASFSGGEDFFYHLRAGDFPLVANLFPPAASPNQTLDLQAMGEAVDGAPPLTVQVPASAHGDLPVSVRFNPNKPAAFARLRIEPALIYVQKDSTDQDLKTLPETGPLTIFGRLDASSRRNTFRLSVKKDDKVTLTPVLRGIASPAILYVAVYDEAGGFVAENDTAGTGTAHEMPLKFKALKDGVYQVVAEDVARRSGPDFNYGIRLERSELDFELASSSDRFVAPRGGSFSTKITAQRKGVNGPISIALVTSDGTPPPTGFQLEQNVIEKGKNDTQLKVTVPKDVSTGTLYHLRMIGTAEEGGKKMNVTVSPPKADPNKPSTEAISVSLQAMPQPPRLLTETFPVCVGPDAPDFFSIELTDSGVRLPNVIGKASFVLRQKALDSKYEGSAQFKFEGLPQGVTVQSGQARGGRINGQVDFICEVSAPPDIAVGSHTFEIIATADHKGVQKEVRLKKVPLHIVKPLELTAATEAPISPGKKQALKITLTRYDKTDPQPVEVALQQLPDGITGPSKVTLQPHQSEVLVELEACEAATEGQYETFSLHATTRVSNVDVAVQSLPIRLEIKK